MVMRQLRIMYFTQPAFLDGALCLTRALSTVAHVALVIEMGPEQLASSAIPLPPHGFGAGIHECSSCLGAALPAGFRKYWESAASVHGIVYDSPHSLGMRAQAIARRAPRLADAFAADVIHLEDLSLRLAPAMVLQRRYPVVVNIHDRCPHPGASSRKSDLARPALVRRADAVVLHNRAQYEYFASRHPRCRHVACIRLALCDAPHRWWATFGRYYGSLVGAQVATMLKYRLRQVQGENGRIERVPPQDRRQGVMIRCTRALRAP